jgi:catechol 2,3-dioxygenase-like lactoylglutathione lyase family enzyme
MPGFPDSTHLCDRLLPEEEFDAAFARLQAAGIAYFGGPGPGQPDEIKHRWGGRGVCFSDPDGHDMEVLTRE